MRIRDSTLLSSFKSEVAVIWDCITKPVTTVFLLWLRHDGIINERCWEYTEQFSFLNEESENPCKWGKGRSLSWVQFYHFWPIIASWVYFSVMGHWMGVIHFKRSWLGIEERRFMNSLSSRWDPEFECPKTILKTAERKGECKLRKELEKLVKVLQTNKTAKRHSFPSSMLKLPKNVPTVLGNLQASFQLKPPNYLIYPYHSFHF